MNVLIYEIIQFSSSNMNILKYDCIYRKQINNNQANDNIIKSYINNNNLSIINRISELNKPNDIKECYLIMDKLSGLKYIIGYRIENIEI